MNHVDRASDLSIRWRKSSRGAQGSECVEVGETSTFLAVRDSKNPSGPALAVSPRAQVALIHSLKAGRFDLG
ncbi:DUF397 domain-containing protein [Saccharopolyspora sp. NPDC000359]|uniref:DUF397 domain-containing protein n=1 Tax=Saccharopolyspora sp. NPDC000359 TaxID=3154251 RepID=UPI00332C0B99